MTTRRTREDDSRYQDYKPPALLEVPVAPDGVIYRWIRCTVHNVDDAENLSLKYRDGWVPVRADEIKDWDGPVHKENKYSGVIGVGDLILCKNARARMEARQRHYEQITRNQQLAVDAELMKQNDSRMPIFKNRTSQQIRGQRKVSFEDD